MTAPAPATAIDETADLYHTDIVSGWEKLYREKRRRLYELLRPHFAGTRALELGIADGESTSHVVPHFATVDVVDASEKFLALVTKRFPQVTAHRCLFEEFNPKQRFGTIFMTHILEHLEEPRALLLRAREWLEPGGRILISVPNAQSLHRLVGVKLGMLPTPYSLNPQDLKLGHRRVYDRASMQALIDSTPFRTVHFTGLMLKPLSNRQIEAHWDEKLVDAFFQLGFDFPEQCAEIVFVLEKK